MKRKRKKTSFTKSLSQLSTDELIQVGIQSDPDQAVFGHVMKETEKRLKDLLEHAPTPEIRGIMEKMMDAETFEQFLRERASKEVCDRIVHDVNRTSVGDQIQLHSKDIWDAWPLFVDETYQGICPEWASEADTVINAFVHWLITNDRYSFYLTVGKKNATQWLRDCVETVTKRRLMEWKYILLTEHGRDTFANSEVRDRVVQWVNEGQVKIGYWE